MGCRGEKGQNELVGHFGTNPILPKKWEITQRTMMGNGGCKFIFKAKNSRSKWERAFLLTH